MDPSMDLPVVVIGAGASGLTSIKSCLEEGLKVVCFEKTTQIGGLWRFREEVLEGVASVMRSTIINSCKEMSAYSDFPPPPEFANFMHNKQQVKYLDMYADRFDLRRHIRFCHEILSIRQTEDFADSGHWTVVVKNVQNGEESSLLASGVMACSGHHHCPNIPEFEGLSEFKGHVRHTHTYKDYKGYEDKRVLIIGIGNSGGDIAVELSRIASKVYLSTRSGTWVLNRVGVGGLPTDYVFLRRFATGSTSILPYRLYESGAQFLHNMKFDHELYNLKPNHNFFSQHPMVNDALPNCILSGTVVIKQDVASFTAEGVRFLGEEKEDVHALDAVILATGYRITFPFAEERLLGAKDNRVRLFKYVFPPDVQPATLAVIGLIQPLGSIVPISELQSRWAARVFSRRLALPSTEAMEEDIKILSDAMRRKFCASPRHTIQVDYMVYMDDVGRLLGVRPSLVRLFFADPRLWFACLFGANAPYQYRLQGPHPWPGARRAILDMSSRVAAPLQTRPRPSPTTTTTTKDSVDAASASAFWTYLLVACSLLAFVLCFAAV